MLWSTASCLVGSLRRQCHCLVGRCPRLLTAAFLFSFVPKCLFYIFSVLTHSVSQRFSASLPFGSLQFVVERNNTVLCIIFHLLDMHHQFVTSYFLVLYICRHLLLFPKRSCSSGSHFLRAPCCLLLCTLCARNHALHTLSQAQVTVQQRSISCALLYCKVATRIASILVAPQPAIRTFVYGILRTLRYEMAQFERIFFVEQT